MASASKIVFGQFTKVLSIPRGFYKLKIKDNKKSLFHNWQLIPNFFITHLPILVKYRTKATVGAVCTLSRNWQFGA
jgi:hypothetical protein